MSIAPTFVARFADGTATRMTTATPLTRFDVGRGMRLAQWAYRSRQGSEPPEIVEAHFEQAGTGTVLASYGADALAAATREGRPEMTRDRADAVAAAILGIMARWLRDPVLRDEITVKLRDEIEDLHHQLLNDIRSTPGK